VGQVRPRTDSDPDTLRCVKVALPISASVSFRQVYAESDGSEEWRSLATESGPRPQELLKLATVAAAQASVGVVDDSPTDVMTRPWWMVQMVQPHMWEPPVPLVPELPIEILPPSTVQRVDVRPARKTTDSRTIVAPLSLLLVALSLVPPVGSAPASSVTARTLSISMHEAEEAQTPPPVVCPPAPTVAPAAVAPVAVAPVTRAVLRRLPAHVPPRHAAPRASTHLVREVPF
jgi:hypothetical protein